MGAQGGDAETGATRANAAADRVEASEDDARNFAIATGPFTSIVDGLAYAKGAKGYLLEILAAIAGFIVELGNYLDKATYDADDDGKVDAAENADTLGGQDSAYHRARTNHTGEQAQSTITGLPGRLTTLDAHAAALDNPHLVTKSQVGLGNVDNTSDVNKPISTAQGIVNSALSNKDIEQDGRLDDVEAKDAEQDLRLDALVGGGTAGQASIYALLVERPQEPNLWESTYVILTGATERTKGGYLIEPGGSVYLDYTDPWDGAALSMAVAVVAGDTRDVTMVALEGTLDLSAEPITDPERTEAEPYLDVLYFAGTELGPHPTFGIRIQNTGSADVEIAQPVAQFAPRLTVPGLAALLTAPNQILGTSPDSTEIRAYTIGPVNTALSGANRLKYWPYPVAGEPGLMAYWDGMQWIEVGGSRPTVALAVSNPSGQTVRIALTPSVPIFDVELAITGAETATLTEADFALSGGVYTADYAGSVDGTYTASLVRALDAGGADGAAGQTASVTVDTTPPSIVTFTATDNAPSIDILLEANERLTTIDVQLTGEATASFDRADFTEGIDLGRGVFVYEVPYTPGADGTYEFTLNAAEDASGNDGADGEKATVVVGAAGASPVRYQGVLAADLMDAGTYDDAAVAAAIAGLTQVADADVAFSGGHARPRRRAPGDLRLLRVPRLARWGRRRGLHHERRRVLERRLAAPHRPHRRREPHRLPLAQRPPRRNHLRCPRRLLNPTPP